MKNIPLPAPPPGAPVQASVHVPDHLPDGSWNTYNGQQINFRQNERGQRELPGGKGGQRFIPPNEYKEFLQLGHGGIFDLNLDSIDVWPWRERGCDLEAYFNYGFNERAWRKYTTEIRKARLDMHLKNQIETTTEASLDFDLPAEVRSVLDSHARMENNDFDPKHTDRRSEQEDSSHGSWFQTNTHAVNLQHMRESHRSSSVAAKSQQESKLAGEERDLVVLSSSMNDAGYEYRKANNNILVSLLAFQQETESLQNSCSSCGAVGDVTPERERSSKLRLLEIQKGIMEVLASSNLT